MFDCTRCASGAKCGAGGRKSVGAAKKRPSEADLAGGAADRQKKKRKRKPKLPKDFDPENPGPMPDPERWLPKWQRSDFKKKRNRRREKAHPLSPSLHTIACQTIHVQLCGSCVVVSHLLHTPLGVSMCQMAVFICFDA